MRSARAVPAPAGPAILLLAGVCALTIFAGLGATALWEPDEPRFAEATRQMLVRGDVLTPWFNDRPRFEKPILFYWLQLPFVAAWGSTEAAARAPAAVCGLLTVLAVFGLGRELVSLRTGVLAAVCLATSLRFVLYARQGLTDVPVVAAITCAVWAMSRAIRADSESSAPAIIAWACTGLGVLLKGPVAFIAPLVWSAWALLDGGWRALARTMPLAGPLVAAAIAAPWFVAMALLHGRSFLDVALGYEIVARYVSPEFPGPRRGLTYFPTVWAGDAMPWSLFFLAAVAWTIACRRRLRAEETRAMTLAFTWCAVVLAVCSASRYKLPHYILPAYPAMALAVGAFLDAAAARRVPGVLWRLPTYAGALTLAACAALMWLLVSRMFATGPRDLAYLVAVVLAMGALAAAILASRQGGALAAVAAVAVTLTVSYGLIATIVAPRELGRFQPARTIATAARRVVGASEPLGVAGGYRGPGLVYYARHAVIELRDDQALVAFLSGPGRRHCVLPAADLERVRPAITRPLRVQAEARVFSIRLKRLLESEPERQVHVLALVTAE